jgi:hypothetical protein
MVVHETVVVAPFVAIRSSWPGAVGAGVSLWIRAASVEPANTVAEDPPPEIAEARGSVWGGASRRLLRLGAVREYLTSSLRRSSCSSQYPV